MRFVTRAHIAAITSIAAALSASLVVGAPAQAGPNAWTQISAGGMLRNIDEPAVARVGKNLHTVWQQEGPDSKASLRTRVIAGNGVAGASVGTVVSGWDSLVANPAIIALAGKPVVVFSGLKPGWTGAMKSAASTDGLTWTEGGDALTRTEYAYPGYGIAAVDDAGTVVVGTNGAGFSVFANRGNPPADEDIRNDQAGSAIQLALARDKATGTVWSAWQSLANTSDPIGVKGIGVQPLYPSVGARSKAPGSTDAAGNSSSADQRIALAARNAADGGVWAAYGVGYPTAQSIRVWKVGTSIARTIRVGGNVRFVSLSAGPGGRLWLSWYDDNADVLHATRSDATVTRFGAIRTIVQPARRGGDTQVWKVASDGALGPLDLVVNASTGAGANNIQLWHQQIEAALSVQVSPNNVKGASGGAVMITVTDAGVGVGGATVNVLGRNYTTNAKGQVGLVVARRTPAGLQAVKATRVGYFPGASVLRIS